MSFLLRLRLSWSYHLSDVGATSVPHEQHQLCFGRWRIAAAKSKEQYICLKFDLPVTSRISYVKLPQLIGRCALGIRHPQKRKMLNGFLILVLSFFYCYLLGVIISLTLYFQITFISGKWHVRGKLCMHCCRSVRFFSL